MELQIRKQLNNIFKHIIINGSQQNEITDPRLYAYIANNQLTIDYGANENLTNFSIGNISFYDDTESGAEVLFASFNELTQTLANVGYPYFTPTESSSKPVISQGNTSTDNLTAGNSYTFTGSGELTLNSDVLVVLFMDQAGILKIQFSQDNINWDSTITKQVNAGSNEFSTAVKGLRYCRVVVTTDSLTTSVFRLQTEFGTFRQGNSPLNASIGLDSDAIITRPSDFYNEANLNRRADVLPFKKFGYNEDVDTGGDEVIWSVGGTGTDFLVDTAETLDFVSTDANDTNGGTGCHGVVIYGIDENRKQKIEVILLDGTTPVTSVNIYLGINRIAVFRAGSGKRNAGTINVTQTTSGIQMAQMPAGEGTTQQCIFYVQADYTALIDYIFINVLRLGGGSDPVVTVKLNVFSFVSNAFYEIARFNIDTGVENVVPIELDDPLPVTEQTVVFLTCSTNTNNTSINARFHLLEYLNI